MAKLVQTAGVGRASFYRNYKSVEDVLLQEAKRVTEEWKREYDSVEHTQPNELLVSLLDFYKAYEEFFLSIYGAGQQQIVLDTILAQIPILYSARCRWPGACAPRKIPSVGSAIWDFTP